jgi:uncharacterized membrane protein
MSKATSKTEKVIPYENNPFNVATLGLKLFFTFALPIALVAATLSILSFYSQMRPSEFFDAQRYSSYSNAEIKSLSAEEQLEARFDDIRNEIVARKDKIERMTSDQWRVVIAITSAAILIILFIGTLFGAMFDYSAAQMRRGKSVTLSDALAGATERFFPYLWLRILVAIKIFLWTLLFIIPGIIMAVRYSLAGVSFYDKKLSADAAIKDSNRLVKGAWLTTNGSQVLFNLITLGMMQIVLQPGTNAVLYRQLDEYDKAGKTKPKAHALSWLTLIIPYILLILFVLLLVSAIIYFLQTTQ